MKSTKHWAEWICVAKMVDTVEYAQTLSSISSAHHLSWYDSSFYTLCQAQIKFVTRLDTGLTTSTF